MKHAKKLLSLLLVLTMVFALGSTAFAANSNSHTITITNTQSGHSYAAYQVFAGDISDGKLTNITWGSGVDGTALLAELKTMDAYESCTSAENVADVLAGFTDNSEQLDAFAKVAGKHTTSPTASSSSEILGENGPYSYAINVTGDGYYLIEDNGPVDDNESPDDYTHTKYILKVVENVTVEAKADVPAIDKVIVNADSANGSDGKGTAQDVGSEVEFKLTSKVPAMDGYDSYTFIVNDTLSDGLTAVDADNDGKIDVKVTIGEIELTEDTDFTVEQDGQSFTITFNNFIDQKSNAGKDIVITYSATINEKALTTNVETNTVYLEYSNNPNNSDSKGKTPDHVVYVYDFDIVIDKYTGDKTTGTRLADAKFVLLNAEKDKYYYYNTETNKVEWVELEDDDAVAAAIKAGTITEVTTDASGAASFQGLDSGTYYLHETEAPAGYNLLKEDVTVTITATYGEDGQITSSSAIPTNNGKYQQTQQVENKAGAQLPSTGGMGTKLFYVLGGILVLGAAVLLITRRRMNASDK